jgi:CPA2 family monovalent cation:H+ antiporter-2
VPADSSFILDLAAVLAAGLLGALAARALALPTLAGYLLAGIALGPSGLDLITETGLIEVMAELGVALLMFAIGVELSLRLLTRVKAISLVAAPLQIAFTTALGYGLGRWLGWSGPQALVLGFVLALSSTMVVVKLLTARGTLQTRHGEAMVAILLVQDLAAVMMVAALPALSGAGGGSALLGLLLKGAGFVVGAVVLARWLVPVLLRVAARSYNREIFVLAFAVLCFGGAASGYWLGLSLALGAFLGGLVVSESPYSHEAIANVTPLRDLFGAVFFVSLGLLSDVRGATQRPGWAALLLLAVLVAKPLLTAVAVLAARLHVRAAVVAGLGLGQIGEFSFLVATLAWQMGLLTPEAHSLIIAVATLSLLAAPAMLRLGEILSARMREEKRLDALLARGELRRAAREPAPRRDHTIICGYGRVGHLVGEALLRERYPLVVIDYDIRIVTDLQARQVPVIYGDAASPALLAAAGADQARLAVVALPEGRSVAVAVRELRRANAQLPISARAHSAQEATTVRAEGADRAVYAELEAGVEVMRQALVALGRDPAQAARAAGRARAAEYGDLLEGEDDDERAG